MNAREIRRVVTFSLGLLALLVASAHAGIYSGWDAHLLREASIDINNTTTMEAIFASPGSYNINSDARNNYSVIDFAGNAGRFPVNNAYPNGVNNDSQNDFGVRAQADVTIPAGTWSIGFGSDDGGRIIVPGITFDSRFNHQDLPAPTPMDQARFEDPRGHSWTGGTFTVAAQTTTTVDAMFFERGGGDSLEVAIYNGTHTDPSPGNGWELLGDGVQGWSVTTDQAPMYPVSYRIDSDDNSYLFISDNDLMPGKVVYTNQGGTQTGTFNMPDGAANARYAHFQVDEGSGAQWGAAQFMAPPGFVFRETGTQYISTNHDQHTVDDDHQWLASHVEWGELGYNGPVGFEKPWPPSEAQYEPQDEGDAGSPYQPGTRRIWWKHPTTDPTNTTAFFSSRLSLEPGAWTVLGTPEQGITEPGGLSAHILRVTDDLGDLNEARDALNAGSGWGNHYASEVRSIANANIDTSASSYGSPVGVLSGDAYHQWAEPEDTAMRLSAYVYAPADDYLRTFAIRSDDDAYLMLGGMEFIRAGGGEHLAPVRFPTQGFYPLELVYRNRGGGAGVEISSREGLWTTFTAGDFQLLGTEGVAPDAFHVRERLAGLGSPTTGVINVGDPIWEGTITPVSDGLRVQQAFPGGGVGSVDDSINFFANPANLNAGVIQTRAIMDMTDPEDAQDGNFPRPTGPAGVWPINTPGNDDNFVTRINGLIYIAAPGTYAFTAGTDDSYEFRVGGVQLGRYPGSGGIPGGTANYMYGYFDKPGLYPVEFYSHEGGYGSGMELARGGSTDLLLTSGSRNPPDNGFTVDWDGVGYRLEPIGRLEAVSTEIHGAALANVPALGMTLPVHYKLEQVTPGMQVLRTPDPNDPMTIVPGLRARYYTDRAMTEPPAFDVVLPEVNSPDNDWPGTDWGSRDNCGVRYTGQVYAPFDGTYLFREHVDDVARLWIDGQQILDNDQWDIATQNTIDLDEGWHDLVFETEEGGGGDYRYLYWDMGRDDGTFDILTAFSAEFLVTLAEGTGMIGDLLNNASFPGVAPFDFGTTARLRLTYDIAGMVGMVEDDFLFIPEPGTLVLLAGGIVALATRRRRRR